MSPEDAIEVTTATGRSIEIGLPGALVADNAVVAEDGTVVYGDAMPNTSVAAQALTDGTVRALIVIDGPAAPNEYAFPIETPGDGGLTLNPDGSVEVWDGNGFTVALVDAPWAYDANGTAIPTAFRLDGNKLVQVVQHAGAAYPVIADPSFQFDCGYITCTLRMNRAQTRNVRDGAWVSSGLLAACSSNVLCYAVIPRVVLDAVLAGRYYENGNCIKYKLGVGPTGAYASPQELKRGTYNCV